MSKMTDQHYLKTEQYKDASNLNARIEIHKRFSTNPRGWNAWVFDTLETLPAQARVLELGCGPAYLWAANAGRIPAGWDITLSDLSGGRLVATTVGEHHMEELKGWLRHVNSDPNFVMHPVAFTLESGLAQLQPY